MNKLTYGGIKRITAQFRGDEAIEIDLLEAGNEDDNPRVVSLTK